MTFVRIFDELNSGSRFEALALGLLAILGIWVLVRWIVKRAITLRAMAAMPSMSRLLSGWVRSRSYSEDELLRADGAGEKFVEIRKRAFNQLAALLKAQG